MRISFNWLKQLVAIDLSPEALSHQLTLAGFEVEDIEDQRTWADGVVVGQVLDCQPHPNADKLRVCQVDIGADEPSTIVCGAPNVETGLFVPVATLGAYLPCIDLKIKPTKLRGIKSAGMICSLAEVGLEKNSEGIHRFDPETYAFKVGEDARPLLGLDDVILDLTSTANRADALSMVGVAREVSAITGGALNLPTVEAVKVPVAPQALSVAIADPHTCPAYIATRIDGVTIAPSPAWLQKCLDAAGIRSINNVVDITNYILLEWGQPLHAFDTADLQQISGSEDLAVGVRLAQPEESLTTLDEQGRSLEPDNLLITLNDQPIALAGVMGGQESEVKASTQSIVLEAALFNAVSVRRSARAQGLRTEASTRYERGVNPAQLDVACDHAIQLLLELTGGTVVSQAIADHRVKVNRVIELRLERINALLGPVTKEYQDHQEPADLEAEDIVPILESLDFELTPKMPPETPPETNPETNPETPSPETNPETSPPKTPQVWSVRVPPHRERDIEREVDLIEEVARLYGYDHFCETLPAQSEYGYLGDDERMARKLREAMRAGGLTELMHYSWTKPGGDRQVAVINPLLIEFSALRTEMLTSIIKAFKFNLEQGNGPLNGFELGRIFWQDEIGLQESSAIAGILGGDPSQGKWVHGLNGESPLTWFQAKGILESIFDRLALTVEYQPDRQDARLHPGRTASLWIGGKRLGQFGQLHPVLRQAQDLPDEVYVFELNLDILLDAINDVEEAQTHFTPFSIYPAVDRDLAFFVGNEVLVSEIEKVIRKAAKVAKQPILDRVELFDEYKGEHVPEGQRSLAFRLYYRSGEKTLTDDEVNPVHQNIREALESKLAVSLRS